MGGRETYRSHEFVGISLVPVLLEQESSGGKGSGRLGDRI